MSCHYVKDPDSGLMVFIPECYGGLYDPEGCTCNIQGSLLEQAVAAQERAEKVAESLRRSLSNCRQQNVRLHLRNRTLRQRIRELKNEPEPERVRIRLD